MKLTQKQVLQIAAEAMADPRTVVRIYDNKATQKLVKERVVDAAKRLKMPIPKGAE